MKLCPSCNEPFEHGPAPQDDICGHCYWAREVRPLGDVDHYMDRTGISPRGHTQESFALAMWLKNRRQIEAWQQKNGLNVPVELLDECQDWRAIWMAKFYQTVGRKPDILADIMLQHQLKETASGH